MSDALNERLNKILPTVISDGLLPRLFQVRNQRTFIDHDRGVCATPARIRRIQRPHFDNAAAMHFHAPLLLVDLRDNRLERDLQLAPYVRDQAIVWSEPGGWFSMKCGVDQPIHSKHRFSPTPNRNR